ncbi:MAG: NAD(+) synthase [Clostridiales Family XIII bacterium]|jgi:NAD+ synthase (glutamine-hydrolysing)|nr:NAD(+) synthase [Clostridiales Family XIII bacterium]
MQDKALGLIRVAAVTPKIKLADPKYNALEILRCARKADAAGAGVALFPELCLTGYTCGDLFYQETLYRSQLEALETLVLASTGLQTALIAGAFLRVENHLYNCALFIQQGRILGAVPKFFLPNTEEFYEARWFASGAALAGRVRRASVLGEAVPFGSLLFRDDGAGLAFGMELCEDLWAPVSPGALLSLHGALILFNPSASNELVGKSAFRRALVLQESAKNICGYAYASAGVHESTTDLVFGGHDIIAENGVPLAESRLFARESAMILGDIDYEKLKFERSRTKSMADCAARFADKGDCETVPVLPLRVLTEADALVRGYPKTPFVPDAPAVVDARCREIFSIQTAGLARRLEHAGGATKTVVGVSGGLDSTLALLVCAETLKLLGRPRSDMIAVTMPGFGTTDETHANAAALMRLLGADLREIPIGDSVLRHFADIGHDPAVRDRTYENAQARERTQILMDVANREGGIVVGTGDLSEAALGWSTYNGDHMSMYGVNAGIPKTLVRFVIAWVMEHRLSEEAGEKDFSSDNARLRSTLRRILDTPISPELLPPDADGRIAQKTEDAIGPYILHDFFLYYTMRFGMRPEKLLAIAARAFDGDYDRKTIEKRLAVFYERFFSQQFKRSCMPDGPKVGTVSLSPRGDWRMPSDASARLWLEKLGV